MRGLFRIVAGLAAIITAALLAATPPAAQAREFEAEGTVLAVSPGTVSLLTSSLDGSARPLDFDTSRVPSAEFTVGTILSVQADLIDGRLVILQVNGLDVNNRGISGDNQADFNPGQVVDDESEAERNHRQRDRDRDRN